jgi:hypothetical protein
MDIRFFKAQPEPQANVQFPAPPADGQEADFVLIALERTNDPDAKNQTGFDFFGAYGSASAITAWAADQSVTAVAKAALPNPLTFYPAPFNEA